MNNIYIYIYIYILASPSNIRKAIKPGLISRVYISKTLKPQEEDEYDVDTRAPPPAPGGAALAPGSDKPGGDVINVFTVASGHMYERLQVRMGAWGQLQLR